MGLSFLEGTLLGVVLKGSQEKTSAFCGLPHVETPFCGCSKGTSEGKGTIAGFPDFATNQYIYIYI